MALKLKVIKSKKFKANDEDHVHYTCAYRGRVFGVSTLRFEKDDFTVKENVLSLNTDVEVIKNTATDELTGQVRTFLAVVPKMDIALAEF